MINAPLVAVSEEQLRSSLRGDLPLVILGSIIAAIGVAALVVHLSRWRSSERVLLWFGLFAGPYGLRLLTNTIPFQMAFGEPQRFWPYANKLVEFATLVPALLLFEDFYGKGWRSSVRWLIGAYVIFATIAFTRIVIRAAQTSSQQLASELFSSCRRFSCWGVCWDTSLRTRKTRAFCLSD